MSNEEKKINNEAEEKKVEPKAAEQAPPADTNNAPEKTGNAPGGPGKQYKKPSYGDTDSEFVERVIKINRVSKVVKGGKNFSFSAMVVIGDGKGQVGIGFGKSNEVVEAIKKGSAQAKESFVKVKLKGDTIPHEIIGRFKSSSVMLKPAGPGTGVIAGGPVRAMCDAVGIKNILTKSLGSRNALNVVRATLDGFEKLRLKRRG